MGVDKTVEKIKKEFDENKNSHVFLIETDDIEKASSDIKNIIKHAIRADAISAKQIDGENYIENIIITPTGKDIIKDDILSLQERIKIKPIISDKMFYMIKYADALNESASNKLLKTIEEPQDNVFGFLIATKVTSLLPTIQSRCQIEKLYYNEKPSQKEYTQEVVDFAEKIISFIEIGELKDYIIYKTCEKKVKDIIKENGKTIANIVKDYYNCSCEITNTDLNKEVVTMIQKNNSLQTRIAKAKYLNKTMNKLTLNMNSELLIDKIIIELKEVKNDANSRNKV